MSLEELERLVELRNNVDFLRQENKRVFNELDGFYNFTDRFLGALIEGKDKDTCIDHWVKGMSVADDIEIGKGYYNATLNNLVQMIDEALKSKG